MTWLALALGSWVPVHAYSVSVTGVVVDAGSKSSIPARLYVQSDGGEYFFAKSGDSERPSIAYAKTNWINTNAIECHVTLPTGAFRVELPPGRYTVTAERGKEWLSASQTIDVGDQPLEVKLLLRRWSNVAKSGWFSGDTHVHRSQDELPSLLLAEDLNVALPQTYWVTKAFTPPTAGDRNESSVLPSQLVKVDDTHVIWPRNTEYELFYVGDKSHTLGAVFIHGHESPFTLPCPPVAPIAADARRQGALLDLDKHDWPWSMMLVPVMKVDLFGLVNNHLWRTEFGITNWFTPAPAYMHLPNSGKSGGERDWINYGCQSYYALLNCGFRMLPTAGTASGVHPVPLGFGRVYVHCPKGFSYEPWMKGLGEGRSFVTTGPMLLCEINGQVPGGGFALKSGQTKMVEVGGTVSTEKPVNEVELLQNGEVIKRVALNQKQTGVGTWQGKFKETIAVSGTSWLAVRCWESRGADRVRFAHTAPSWFDDPAKPLLPRRFEVDWLVERMRGQIAENTGILPPKALAEYLEALDIYEKLQKQAR